MIIFVNGEKITDNFSTLHDVCKQFSDDPESIATAINGEFVAKPLRISTYLSDGDHIEIIAPLEGG